MEEMPIVSVNTLLPVVESFFTRMTPEQCKSLKAGKPDEATKILLAEILLEIVEILRVISGGSPGLKCHRVSGECAVQCGQHTSSDLCPGSGRHRTCPHY